MYRIAVHLHRVKESVTFSTQQYRSISTSNLDCILCCIATHTFKTSEHMPDCLLRAETTCHKTGKTFRAIKGDTARRHGPSVHKACSYERLDQSLTFL